MKIIGIYRVPFKYEGDDFISENIINSEIIDIKNDPLDSFLKFFKDFLYNACLVNNVNKEYADKIKNLKLYNSKNDENVKFILEYQFNKKGYNYDFLLLKDIDKRLNLTPITFEYFDSDRFVYEIYEKSERELVIKDIDIDNHKGNVKQLIAFVKGETLKQNYPLIMGILIKGILTKKFRTIADLYMAWAELISNILLKNDAVIRDKARFDDVVFKNILKINYIDKKKKILNTNFMEERNNLLINVLPPFSNLFEYVLWAYNVPKEILPYINDVINLLNGNVKSLEQMVKLFGYEEGKCKLCK